MKNLPPKLNNLTWKIATSLEDSLLAMTGTIMLLIFLPSLAYAEVKLGDKFGFGDIASLGQGTNLLVVPVFSIAAALVVIYFLIGAFKYLKSAGNKEEAAGARGMITHAMIGFLILMFAFLILQFLLSSLFGITNFQLFQG